MRQQVKQAVIFPADRELMKNRKENAVMKAALKHIAEKDFWPDSSVQLVNLQSCVAIAEEALEDIDGD